MELEAEVRAFVERHRVARLATRDISGWPHIVPIVFTWIGGDCYTVIDEKPKRTRRLQRLRNIEADPRVALLFDVYEEDWSRLGWVMLRGRASSVVESGERRRGVSALRAKYSQYGRMPLDGPLLRFIPERASHWGDLGGSGE